MADIWDDNQEHPRLAGQQVVKEATSCAASPLYRKADVSMQQRKLKNLTTHAQLPCSPCSRHNMTPRTILQLSCGVNQTTAVLWHLYLLGSAR